MGCLCVSSPTLIVACAVWQVPAIANVGLPCCRLGLCQVAFAALRIVLVFKACAVQVCRCTVRVFENGFSDLGVPQVGIDQGGTGQVSLVEARGTQVGVCQVGIGQDGLLQPCATQVGIRQDGVGQVCVFEDRVPEVSGGEVEAL